MSQPQVQDNPALEPVEPRDFRYLRACMVCGIVLTRRRFILDGCPNCEEYLQLQGSDEAVEQCTSQVFEGQMAIVDPKKSWVAKWQRLTNYVPGVYALKVSGTLSEDVRLRIEQDFGVRYIPRDGTAQDE